MPEKPRYYWVSAICDAVRLLGCHNNRSGSAGDAQDNKGGQQAGDAAGHKGEQVVTGLTAYRARTKGSQRSADLVKSKNPGNNDRRIFAAEYFIRQYKSCRTCSDPIKAIEDRKSDKLTMSNWLNGTAINESPRNE